MVLYVIGRWNPKLRLYDYYKGGGSSTTPHIRAFDDHGAAHKALGQIKKRWPSAEILTMNVAGERK